MGRTRLGGWLARVAVAAGTVMVMLAALELATRVYTYRQGRGFAEDPKAFNSPFFTTEDWPAPLKSGEAYEFKNGDWLTPAEARRAVVVVCLGGSTTLSQDDQHRAYPRVLEGLLQQELGNSAIRVMNAGGHAFSSAHSLVNLGLRILTPEIKPDVIVVYENINDASANYFGAETLPDYGNKYMTDFYLGYRHKTGLTSYFLRQSRFFRFVWYSAGMLTYTYDRAPDSDYQAGATIFRRNLRNIAALAAANDVAVVFGTQPARSTLGRRASHQAYNEIIREVAEGSNAGLADVARSVTDDELDFIDDVHYSSEGVAKVARAFLPQVKRLVAGRLDRLEANRQQTSPALEQ